MNLILSEIEVSFTGDSFSNSNTNLSSLNSFNSFNLSQYFLQYKIFSSFGKRKGLLNNPYGITICSNFIFIVDSGNHRIQAFHLNNLTISHTIGGIRGNRIGDQFNFPKGITCYKDLLYIADTENNRIQMFTIKGTFVGMFGHNKRYYYSDIDLPHDIAICDDFIFILDTDHHQVQIFDINVTKTMRFGSYGTKPKQLNYPEGITCSNSQVFIADTHNHRVQVFSLTGKFLQVYNIVSNFPSAITSCNGRLFIGDSTRHRVTEFSIETGYHLLSIGSEGTEDYQFKTISGLHCEDGVLFVSDFNNHRIHIIPAKEILQRELDEGFHLHPKTGKSMTKKINDNDRDSNIKDDEEEDDEDDDDDSS